MVRDDAQFQEHAALKLIGAGMDTAELLSGRAPVPGDGLWQMPSNANLHFLLAEAYRRGDAKRTPGKKKSGPYVNCSKIFRDFAHYLVDGFQFICAN